MSFDRLIRAAELFSAKASEVCSSDVEMKGKDYRKDYHIHGVEFVLRTVLSPSYKGSRSYDDRMSSLRDKLEFHCEALCVRRKGDPENTRPSEASLLLAQQILLVLRGQEHDAMAMQLAATRRHSPPLAALGKDAGTVSVGTSSESCKKLSWRCLLRTSPLGAT